MKNNDLEMCSNIGTLPEGREMKPIEFCLRLPALIINNLNDEQQKIWDDKIRVIEYSAYEKLQARHKKLLEALENVKNEAEPLASLFASEAIEADKKSNNE